MGDIADMMLDGILDASGEYTGKNYGHPVYPKGWFGKGPHNTANGVKKYLRNLGMTKEQVGKTIKKYAVEVLKKGDISNNAACIIISSDFGNFIKFAKSEQEKMYNKNLKP